MVSGKKMTLLKDNVLIANNTIVWNPENEICTLVLCCSAALMWWRWGQKKKFPDSQPSWSNDITSHFYSFWLSSILQTPLTIAARLINFNGNGSKAKVKRWRKYSNNGPTLVSQAYAKRQKIPQYDAHFSYGVSASRKSIRIVSIQILILILIQIQILILILTVRIAKFQIEATHQKHLCALLTKPVLIPPRFPIPKNLNGL